MATPRTRAEARELVRKITKNHGFISPEKLEQLESTDPELRREIEEALLAKDKLIGSSVLTLATNLYTSKARFVFELIQNADDNLYSKAKAAGETPYVSFHMHTDRIIVECNEDGFTNTNLAAICAIGKSSKTAAQGYIGEKGIGFKSVFMAASKVHIQSGLFSFCFKHKSGDSGMGMISPLWEETEEEFPSPLTRITLYLRDDGDTEVLSTAIQDQFKELQETLLLFMKNLGKINVIFHDEMSQQWTSTYSIERPRPTYAVLKKAVTAGGETLTKEGVRHFHIMTLKATNLSKNENRTYSETEEKTQAYSKSQVMLAFPLTESQDPIFDEQQFFYVFLPVRTVGFNFLIQADFVTDANRQDIVRDSRRNSQLINTVADAFIKAIPQFDQYGGLRYTWMRYLPNDETRKQGGLWRSLADGIKTRLRVAPVFYDRNGLGGRLITQLCRLPPDYLDENGEPLFEDGMPCKIISQNYAEGDLNILSQHGLPTAAWPSFITWLRKDLDAGAHSSRMRSPTTSEKWHEKVVAVILGPILRQRQGWSDVRSLALIPLENGDWVCGGPAVHFSKAEGLEIPSSIDLQLVSKRVTNPSRIKLFKHLGVWDTSAARVRESILRFYETRQPDIATSKCHLEFLYLSEKDGTQNEYYGNLTLCSQDGSAIKPASHDIYISDDNSHGASELFRKTESGPNPGDGAPGYPASFVHEEYFKQPPADTQEWTWLNWFHGRLGVKKHVDLVCDEQRNYIQQYRPEKFLGAIYEYHRYNPRFEPQLVEVLRDTTVLCRLDRRSLLRNAYFPIVSTVERTDKYLGEGAFFPWLKLEFETPKIISPRWGTVCKILKLTELGSPQLEFHLAAEILSWSLRKWQRNLTADTASRLFAIYDHFQEKLWAKSSQYREALRPGFRSWMSESKGIYIPRSKYECTWASPDDCVWDAPEKMRTKFVLKRLYGNCFCRDGPSCPYFSKFFLETLGIDAACSWQNYVEELKHLKNRDKPADEGAHGDADDDDHITVKGIYTALDALMSNVADTTAIRDAFEGDALIYAEVDGQPLWHRPSQCVWSAAIRLRGAACLSEQYRGLERLFLKALGVKEVNLVMAIDELKETGSRQPAPVTEIKESIWTVNSLLSIEAARPESSEIVKRSIFPIRYPDGSVSCGTEITEFFIVDREPLKQYFEDQVKLLDFTLEEVARLRPFLRWTGLKDRYLSHCAKEVTIKSFPEDSINPELDLSRKIRHRAHHFLRVACQFNSPRSISERNRHSLYETLKSATIFGTKGNISSTIQISQDGKLYQAESKRITLHLEEHDSRLDIYVPCGKDDQQFIFTNKLPERLFKWMMTHPDTRTHGSVDKDGVNAIKDILHTPYTKLAEALEELGIATIDVEDTDEAPPGPETSLTAVSLSAEVQNLHIGDGSEQGGTEHKAGLPPVSGEESVLFNFEGATASTTVRSSRTGMITPSSEYSAFSFNNAKGQYVEVLSRVIAAGRRDSLPLWRKSSKHEQSGWRDLGLRNLSQSERDTKIGAAGELYVFELLSHLRHVSGEGLPGFGMENWRSNIRIHVATHPEYKGMAGWYGPETSDIVYDDSQGALTGELIQNGYLKKQTWEREKPRYFIEVKSTPLSCDTPFYMSKAQYQRMQDDSNTDTNNTATIYAIFRVYWLGREDMGLQIYLDPESLRRSGQLKFEEERWSVVPGTGQNGV